MKTMTELKLASNLDEALEMHKEITGGNFFECFENEKPRKESIIEEVRVKKYMVDEKGGIYYLVKGRHSEIILNRLTLHSMLTGGGCGLCTVLQNEETGKGVIVHPTRYDFSRCNENRKLWGEHNATMQDNMSFCMTTEHF